MAIVGKAVSAGGGTSKPKFEYSGEYNVRDDGVVELLTSGTLQFSKAQTLDVFMVGGGGHGGNALSSRTNSAGGGGGGQARTFYNVPVTTEQQINVVIGAGGTDTSGAAYRTGGDTTFGSLVAKGGMSGFRSYGTSTATQQHDLQKGADGGSGGGGGFAAGGSDGGDGVTGTKTDYELGGSGQMAITREFGEPTGKLYAGGGSGGTTGSGSTPLPGGNGGGGNGASAYSNSSDSTKATDGGQNTGGGGGGGAVTGSFTAYNIGGNGGSGIVCFRTAVGVKTEVLNGTYKLNDTLTRPSFSGQVVDGIWSTSLHLWSIGMHGDYLGIRLYPSSQFGTYDLYDFVNNKYATTVSSWRNGTFENCQVRKEFYDWWIANTTLVS